jgi:hypothetical protein
MSFRTSTLSHFTSTGKKKVNLGPPGQPASMKYRQFLAGSAQSGSDENMRRSVIANNASRELEELGIYHMDFNPN